MKKEKLKIVAIILLCLFAEGIINKCFGQKVSVKIPIKISVPQGKVFNLDAPKDEGTITTNTANYKGINYPVFATKNGKLFIKLVSPKTNKNYRKYIKNSENEQK